MLTLKQEAYVQGLIRGLSQREAYKQAYNAERMTDKTIDERACVLLTQDKVRARYEELRGKIDAASAGKAILSAAETLERISGIAMGKPIDAPQGSTRPLTWDIMYRSLQDLAKHHKLLTDRVESDSKVEVILSSDIGDLAE